MRSFQILVFLAALLTLAACSDRQSADGAQGNQMMLSPVKSVFKNTDITGIDYAKDFALIDHHGKQRTLADFKGKAVVIFFGYMHCPDVCPTTMTEMSSTMKQLGPQAENVQILFVSVDPERDTPELLAQYVPAFDPRFLGLTGDKAAIEKMAKEFRVFYQKVPGKEPGSYSMDHSAGSYVFDPQGRIRLFVKYGNGGEPLAHDLKILLSGA